MKHNLPSIAAILLIGLLSLTGCSSEAEKQAVAAKTYVEKSQAALDSVPVGKDEDLELDADPTPPGEKESSNYITDNPIGYLKRCEKLGEGKTLCYEEKAELFKKEAELLVEKLTTNIHLLPNDFQRKAVQDELVKILDADCGNNAYCYAEKSAHAYEFASWIDGQARAYKKAKERPIDVSEVGNSSRFCASSDKPVQIYDDEGNPTFELKPKDGKMLFFTTYFLDDGKAIAVESRDKHEPFQFNGRIIGYINPNLREDLSKGAHIFACQRLNEIYR